MKFFSRWLILALAMVSVIVGLMACDDNPTTELCLLTGRECVDGDGGSSGTTSGDTGSAAPCTANPAFGKPCDGNTGINVCAGNGVDLVCSHSPNGSGNDGGTGGYNCATHPDNGKFCKTLDGRNGHQGCNANGTALICYPDPGSSGSDGGITPPPPYNCAKDPELRAPCRVNGHNGVKVCAPSGTGLVCECTEPGGCLGSTNDGGTGNDAGGTIYNCSTDPQMNTACTMGVGECRNSGVRICNPRGDGLLCNVSAKPAPSTTDVCGNGLDDNCNGSVDEPGCTSPNNDAGAGDSGTDAGGNPDGGATCTFAPVSTQILGQSSLNTLLKGESNISRANPRTLSLVNNDLLSLAAGTSLSIGSFSAGTQLNYWEPNVGGGSNPIPLIDTFFCRQLGITPSTPTACSASVIGDRLSMAYLSALRITWECWRKGAAFCPSTISGLLPRDLFVLKKVVQVGNGLNNFTGTGWGVLEAPPQCR